MIPETSVRITAGRATRRRVPFLLASPVDRAPAPAVVMVHGMWMTKEQLLPLMLPFVHAGLHAVAIDARGHGERWESWQSAGRDGNRRRGAASFMNLAARLALQTADDVVAICRWLLRRDETLDGRIALWGVSLGCNAVLAAAPLVRPETVAAAYGHADWDLMWKLSWPLFHPGDPSPPPQWTADVRRLIARLEAIEHAAEFFPTAILLVHGAQDRPMVDGMRSLHRRIAPYYARDRRRIRFDRRPGGHAFDDAMAESMRAWIWNWLNRG